MSAWTFIKHAYTGAFALLQRAAEALQTYWPVVLIVAALLILIGWLASDQSVPVEDAQPAPLSEDEQAALSDWFLAHDNAQVDVAYARGQMLESEEAE